MTTPTHSGEHALPGKGGGEDRLAAALAPFGWTCGPEFWQRYYSDPWVFNLANAVQALSEHLELVLAEATPSGSSKPPKIPLDINSQTD